MRHVLSSLLDYLAYAEIPFMQALYARPEDCQPALERLLRVFGWLRFPVEYLDFLPIPGSTSHILAQSVSFPGRKR